MILLTILLIAQVGTTVLPDVLPNGIVPTGIVGLVIYIWRQDRKDRADEKKQDADRYEALAKDFRSIVTDNTAALTSLRDMVAGVHEALTRPKAT